jgi:hypothetical protein
MAKKFKFKLTPIALLLGVGIMFLFHSLYSRENPGSSVGFGQFYKPNASKVTRSLSNVANMSYWMFHDGTSGHDPFTGSAGGIYPRGTAGVIYQDGFIYGGYVQDPDANKPQLRVGGQTYVIGTTPGWVAGGVPVSSENERVAMYRINKNYTVPFASLDEDQQKAALTNLTQDAAEINGVSVTDVSDDMIVALVDQYANDWANWPADLGAPTYADGTPGLAGADQVMWFVVNDFNDANNTLLYGSPGLGMELQITMWAYNQPGSTLGQIVFKKYKMINKGGFEVQDMYVCQWSDPDVGTYTDDLAGCDIERSIGFAYSGNITDGEFSGFNLAPAAVGYDFFQGPIVDGVAGEDLNGNGVDDADDFAIFNLAQVGPGKINLPMTSFGYFAAGSPISDPPLGDYDGTLQWYNLLRGYTPTNDLDNPTPYVAGSGPNQGSATIFPLDGDPFRRSGDIDATGTNLPPGDRRILLPSGPFTMAPGDTQEVVIAVVGGIITQAGGTNRNAVEQMKLNDDFAQFIYNKLFEGIPTPPAKPSVTATEFEEKVVFDFGSDQTAVAATESDDPVLGFNFEGYNVYQLPSPTASKDQATLVATFDKANGVQLIRGKKFLPEFGDIVEVPIQNGSDTGIQRYFVADRDYINDLPLYAGNTYYFSVTAYNYNSDPTVPEPSLESDLKPVIAVTPQGTAPGTRYPNEVGDALAVTKVGGSTGSASVTVIDPKNLKGHDYKVEFVNTPQYSTNDAGDTTGTWYPWNLVDVTDSKVLVTSNTNLSGDDSYPLTHGFQAKVEGPKTAGLAGWDYTGDRWVSGVDWGGADFFGGLDIGANFFGSTLTLGDLVPIKIVFQDQADVDANGYVGKGALYRRDQGYAHAGVGDMPMAAYDMTDPANPRRINICFVESDGADGAAANGIWDMGWDGSAFGGTLGAREYLFFMKSDYSEGAGYDDTNWGPAADVLYAIWPRDRSRPYLHAEFEMNIYANLPNTPSDSYTFSTEGVTIADAALQAADVEKINVFPNPYYAYNPSEPDRFTRFVTFNHMPTEATVRIFNLAGIQVRKLDKNDDSQFLRWDLRNENDLPVASGMYIAHVDMPAPISKTKILKVFIIQGAQILQYY